MATQRIPHFVLLLGLLLVPFLMSGCILDGCDCEDEIEATYGHFGQPEEIESVSENGNYEMTLRYTALGFEKKFVWGEDADRCCHESHKEITDDDGDDDDGDNGDGGDDGENEVNTLSLNIGAAQYNGDTIEAGTILTYTITATNTGNTTQDNVAISVTEPESEPLITCTILAPNETCEDDYTYTVTEEDVSNTEIVIKAEVVSNQVTTPETDEERTPVGSQTTALSLTEEANFPPLPVNQKVFPHLNEPKEIELSAIDPDGDMVTYSTRTAPTKGTLAPLSDGKDGFFIYTPGNHLLDGATDFFTFVANDGQLDSIEAKVSITVGNRSPVAADVVIDVTAGNDAVTFRLKGTDANGDPLTYIVVDKEGIKSGSLPNHPDDEGWITYLPGNGSYEETFTYKVIDSFGRESNIGRVTMKVTEPRAAV